MTAIAERVAARIGSRPRVPSYAWVPAAALVLLVVTWPVPSLAGAVTGLDTSWQIALQVAASEGMNHGEDFSFTYGPLGFLTVPELYVSAPSTLALAFVALCHVVLAVTLLASTSRFLPPVAAVAVTYFVVASPLPDHDVLTLIVFAWAAALATERLPPPAEVPMAVMLGAASAIGLLVKFNGGATAVVVTTLACALARSPLLAGGVAGGAFAFTLFAAWLATGNPIGNFAGWFADSLALASDYSESLALVIPGRAWTLYVALGLIAWLFVIGLGATADWTPRRRVVAGALLGAFCFSFFKSGFVRHDGHELATFSALAIAPLAIGARATRYASTAASMAAVAAILAMMDVTPDRLDEAFDPAASVRSARFVLGTSRVDARRLEVVDRSKRAARTQLSIGENVLEAVRGRGVAVYPSELSVAWAYDLDWRPLPSLQAYAAYPERLDDGNAAFLREERPERVLNHAPATPFDSPAAYLSLVCSYGEVVATESWQVLAPRGRSCGDEKALGSVSARAGELVSVPDAPNTSVVIARFRLAGPSPAERLRTLVFRPSLIPTLTLDDARQVYFFTTTASQPHVLRTPDGWSRSKAFGTAANVSTFRLNAVRGEFRVDFAAIPVR